MTLGPPPPWPRPLQEMSSRHDWLLTLRQTLLSVPKLWLKSTPTFHLDSVAVIDDAFVRDHRIAGMIWDVDGTLMPRHGSSLSPVVRANFERLIAMPGLRHVILSNCGEDRFLELGRIFPEIPVLKAYRTAEGWLFRRLLGSQDDWSEADPSYRVGARPIRKPSLELTEFAIRELACEPERVVMVGDQYFTDIVGANLAGIRSIKVPTLNRESFPLMVRRLQRLEEGAYRRGRRGVRSRREQPPRAVERGAVAVTAHLPGQ